MMLTPEIPPCYFNANKSEGYPQIDQSPYDPLPHLAFKVSIHRWMDKENVEYYSVMKKK